MASIETTMARMELMMLGASQHSLRPSRLRPRSLTRLNVAHNYLNRGGNGVELLRDAVREREGFKLIADDND